MRYLPVSMTENESSPSAIHVYHNEYGCHNQENDEKRMTGKQADRFAMTVITLSIDNKTTVCHLAIPREVSYLLRHGATGRRQ